MVELVVVVAGAAVVFAGTNVDDLVVLTVLFLAARRTGRPPVAHVWVGQYAGIAVLVAASLLAALGLALVPEDWVGLLGLVPLGLGLRGLVLAWRDRGEEALEPVVVAGSWLAVAAITIANGADNVSVYTPLFRTVGLADTVLTVGVFAVLVAAWCAVASWLGSHRRVVELIERRGEWLVPLVFIALGIVILVGSGVLGRLIPNG